VATERSIVVMPFDNMSSDADQVYFSDGIAEDISILLGKLPELRVVGRLSARTLQSQNLSATEIAERVGVEHILRGSVRRFGERLRITVELVEAAGETQVWSEAYDREMDDLFEIQDQISAMVVANLQVEMLGTAPTVERIDTEAYRLYLQGRHLNHSGQFDQLPLAEELLKRSLELEPDYVLAMSELGRVYLSAGGLQDTDERMFESEEQRRETVRELVRRITEIAPSGPKSLGWRSWIARAWDHDIPAAARLLEQALAADPGNVSTMRAAPPLLMLLGQTDDALAVSKYVAERDPSCINCLLNLYYVNSSLGKLDDAEKILRDAVAWEPDRFGLKWALGSVLLQNGKPAEALEVLERETEEGAAQLGRIMALHDLGRSEEFEAEFAAFRVEVPDDYEAHARIYAWTGDHNKALTAIEELVEQRGPNALLRLHGGFYAELNKDPRFVALLAKHGLSFDANSYPDVHITIPPLPE